MTQANSRTACELCRILTDDGLELSGFYVGPGQKPDAGCQESEVAGLESEVTSPEPSESRGSSESRIQSPESPDVPNFGFWFLSSGFLGEKVCLVHVHGWDGNFYENRFVDHAAWACGRLGVAFAAFNNRGHDYVADILRSRRSQMPDAGSQRSETRRKEKLGYVQAGGIFERFAECLLDVKAAVDFAEARGCRKVFLQGHSLGAMKVTHYLARSCDPRVAGLILLSPADTMGWVRKKLGRAFPKALAHAQRLMREGRDAELMPRRFHETPVSARTFVEAYGPKSLTGIFNISRTDRQQFPELTTIRVPVLLAVGTVEEYFVGRAQRFVDGIADCLENCPSFTGFVIQGAPHNYLGYEPALGEELEHWLRERIQVKA